MNRRQLRTCRRATHRQDGIGWLVLIAVLCLGAPGAPAATMWWDTGTDAGLQPAAGQTTNVAWDTTVAAWALAEGGTTTPSVWTNNNVAVFSNAAAISTVTVNNVMATNVAVYAGTNIFVPGTGPLTIGAGGLTNNVAATLIYAPVELAAAQTWGIGQDLTVYGQIRSQSSGLTKTGAGALTLSGNNNNLIGGAFAASGGPLQIFNGVHTFSSTFTVSGNNTLTVVSNATVSSTADSVTLASSGSGSKAIVRGGHGLGRPECLNKDLRLGLDLDRFRTVD